MFTEIAICPRCETTIDPANVLKTDAPERPGYTEPLVQHVQCKCQACGLMVEMDRVPAGGAWEIVGSVRVVTDRRRHQAFDARFDNVRRGNLQVA